MTEFSTRATQLADAYSNASPAPEDQLAHMVWEPTLRSLRALRSVLDGSPYASEETSLLETYAQAHVALLEALKSGRRR